MDEEILARVQKLLEEEHSIRSTEGPHDTQRLQHLEETLDQCWDLLRQRRARREFDQAEDYAVPRDVGTVEGYQQ